MKLRHLALGLAAAASLAPSAVAADKPLRALLGGTPAPKAPHPYPLSDRHYIKQHPGPTIACGSCFGFHATQWRPWAEACNEPQVVEVIPPRAEAPVDPAPMLPPIEKPREQPPAPKPAKPMEPAKPAPKKAEPKPNKKVELPPLVPAPVVVMSPAPVSVPTKLEIVVPELPVSKPIPVLPSEPKTVLPTIIVPLESK